MEAVLLAVIAVLALVAESWRRAAAVRSAARWVAVSRDARGDWRWHAIDHQGQRVCSGFPRRWTTAAAARVAARQALPHAHVRVLREDSDV